MTDVLSRAVVLVAALALGPGCREWDTVGPTPTTYALAPASATMRPGDATEFRFSSSEPGVLPEAGFRVEIPDGAARVDMGQDCRVGRQCTITVLEVQRVARVRLLAEQIVFINPVLFGPVVRAEALITVTP